MKINRIRNCLGVVLLAVGTAAGAAQAQTPVSVADFQSTEHVLSREAIVYWMNAVNERIGDAVVFTHYPAQQAAPAAELLDAARNGVVQVSFVGVPYNTDRLPLNSVVGLPGFYTSSAQGSAAIQEMTVNGPLRDEFLNEGVIPIFALGLPPYQILLSEGRVTLPEDWAGLNIRTGGTTQALTARSLGAVGISLPGPEVYSAVERGRVDGILFPLSSVPGYNLQEVVAAISTNGALGGYNIVLAANRDFFETLPVEVQQAMLEAGRETSIHAARAMDDSISILIEEWTSAGIDVFQFTQEELDATAEAVSSVQEEWVQRISERNPEAADVLDAYREAIAAH